MAEAFLTPIFERLLDVLNEQVRSLKGVDKEVKSLKEKLAIIQPFLKDAEAKSDKGDTSEGVKEWLRQMRELCNRIHDVVDDFVQYVVHPREQSHVFIIMKGAHLIKKLKVRGNIASDVASINKKLCEMKDIAQTYGLQPLELGGSNSGSSKCYSEEEDELRLSSYFIPKDELVGIDSTSRDLVDKLVGGTSWRMVISLVGEGGIGKTTLAKNVYDNEAVEAHFDCRAWISVSQSYNTRMLLMDMIKQMFPAVEDSAKEIDKSEQLVSLLRQHLMSKKYLVVFDDVWKQDFWRVIKHAVPIVRNQGRIIVTTRNATVANAFRETPYDHEQVLKPWSQELAWKLFCKKAFQHANEKKCPEELKQLSLEFVSKCQGLPLVIVAIGSMLSMKKGKPEWEDVLADLSSESTETPQLKGILKILSLSYFDLPYHLRCCFLYFGLFPEDCSIIDVALYKLWTAEGFIGARKNKTLEEVAEEYLNELIGRNLVAFDVPDGVHRICRVHDLMRDIIISRAEETSFFQILDGKETTSTKEESRRLAIYHATESVFKNLKGDGFHSLYVFNVDKLTTSVVATLFKRFKHLRVLNFHGAALDELPDEIGCLFHLKYLSLGFTKVKKIPKSIGKLVNLQTLDIRHSLVSELPSEINKLHKLRHLLGFSFEKNSLDGVRLQGGVGELSMLQTLSLVKAHPNDDGLVILSKDLEKLTQMKELGISELTRETGRAVCTSIEKMSHLKCLDLHAIRDDEILDLQHISSPPLRLEYLALKGKLQDFPNWIPRLPRLQKLILSSARLTDEPLTSLKDMPDLVYLNLDAAYDGEELHFERGGFQKLKVINLKNLKRLKVLKIDEGALSLLEKLEIGPSKELKQVPTDIINLRRLKHLDIWEMPMEFVAAMQPNGGSEFWKIRHVARVRFWSKQGAGDYVECKLPYSHPEPLNAQVAFGMGF